MPARSKLSKLIDDTKVAYVEVNAEVKEFRGLLAVPQKCAKLYGRSVVTVKLSKEGSFNNEKSPKTLNTKRFLFKRIMERNMAHWQQHDGLTLLLLLLLLAKSILSSFHIIILM